MDDEDREFTVAVVVMFAFFCVLLFLWVYGSGCVATEKRIVSDPAGTSPQEVRQADLMAELDAQAALAAQIESDVANLRGDYHKNVTNHADPWPLRLGVAGGVALAVLAWWARWQAKAHGYVEGRKRHENGD
ncbi:MAG: hypothetical protein GY952_12030 [Rhodobacteraceae bacterium]|nr:hypothetical protein [Paracoccaceae bacterium]